MHRIMIYVVLDHCDDDHILYTYIYMHRSSEGSFPNGGLRVTHSAAAFTTWDRASPPFAARLER